MEVGVGVTPGSDRLIVYPWDNDYVLFHSYLLDTADGYAGEWIVPMAMQGNQSYSRYLGQTVNY